MTQLIRYSGIALCVLLLLSCTLKDRRTLEPEQLQPRLFEETSAETPEVPESFIPFRMQSGDKLAIDFPRTPELNSDVVIRPDGAISTQFGEVLADGMTVSRLTDVLEELYAAKLRHPRPVVTVTSVAARVFYVFGEVQAPDKYSFEEGTELVSALAMAGGLLRSANLKKVFVLRTEGKHKYSYSLHNLNDLVENPEATPTWLEPNDIVVVPSTAISDIGDFVDMYITRFIPPIDSFTRGRYYWKLVQQQD